MTHAHVNENELDSVTPGVMCIVHEVGSWSQAGANVDDIAVRGLFPVISRSAADKNLGSVVLTPFESVRPRRT